MQPVTVTLNIHEIEDVKELLDICKGMKADIDASSGRYTANAKSELGLFSLNFSKNIKLTFYSEDEGEIDRFLLNTAKWVVK